MPITIAHLALLVGLFVSLSPSDARAGDYRDACEPLLWRDDDFTDQQAVDLTDALRYLGLCHPLFTEHLKQAASASEIWFALARPTGYCLPPPAVPLSHDGDSLWNEWRGKINSYREAAQSIGKEVKEVTEDPRELLTLPTRERLARRVLDNVIAMQRSLDANEGIVALGRYHEPLRLQASRDHEMMLVYPVPNAELQMLDARFAGLMRIFESATAQSLALVFLAHNMGHIVRMNQLVTDRTQVRLLKNGAPGPIPEEARVRNTILPEVNAFREDIAAAVRARGRSTKTKATPPRPEPPLVGSMVKTPQPPTLPTAVVPVAPVPPPRPVLDPNASVDTLYEDLYSALGGLTQVLAAVGMPSDQSIDLDPDTIDLSSLGALTAALQILNEARARAFETQREVKRQYAAAAELIERITVRSERILTTNGDQERARALSAPDRRTLEDAANFAKLACTTAVNTLGALGSRLDLLATELLQIAKTQLALTDLTTATFEQRPAEAEIEALRASLRTLREL